VTPTGTLTFEGASLSGSVYNGGGVVGYGTLVDLLNNTRYVTLAGSLTLMAAPTNTGTILVGANQLIVTPNWTNSGTIILDGGSIRVGDGAGLLTNAMFLSTGSSIDGNFTNSGTYALTDHSSITGNFTNAGWTRLSGYELRVQGASVSNLGDGITTGVFQYTTGTLAFAPGANNATFTNTVTNAAAAGGNYSTRALNVLLESGTVNFEVTSTDMGSDSAGVAQLSKGFALGTLTLPNTLTLLRLTDFTFNQGGATQEAIYVNNLMLGSTLGLANFDFGVSGLKIYYNNIVGDGGADFVGTFNGDERQVYFGNIVPLSGPAVVPEPATVVLLLIGLPMMWFARRRFSKKR
jgi:hypothetical protein